MRALRILTVLAILATLLWGGYWFAGRTALDRLLVQGLAQVPQVSLAGHSIRGFPNRFDITLDQPRVSVPGLDWSSPFVQVFALSYRLNHLVAVFAQDQALTLGGRAALIHSQDLRASLVMEAGRDLPLDEVVLAGTGLDLRIDGSQTQIDALRMASRRIEGRRHRVALLAEGLLPDATLIARLDPQGHWPRRYTVLRLEAEAEFDRALDRHALTGAPPQLAQLTLTGARLGWQDSEIDLSGRLTPDAAGVLSGEVLVVVTGWPALLERARAAGLLQDGGEGLLGPLLRALPTESNGERVEVPLSVTAGDVRLGPLLLGTLPPLR